MNNKHRIVIVCGCGCNFTDRHKDYLKRVHDFTVNDGLTKSIIVCDGLFWKSSKGLRPKDSRIMNFLLDLRSGQFLAARPGILVEFESQTVSGNIRNASRNIKNWRVVSPALYSIVIFCDVLQALEAKLAAIKYFPDYDVEIETHDISRGKNIYGRVFRTLATLFRVAWIP